MACLVPDWNHVPVTVESGESPALAIGLSAVAGCVDVLGYLGLVHVFSAHMSGNFVTTAEDAVRGRWSSAGVHALPLPLFVVGVALGTLVVHATQRRFRNLRQLPVLGLELLVLCGCAIGIGSVEKPGSPEWGRLLLVALRVLAMGIQNATVRRCAGERVRTTFVTGSMVDLVEGLTRRALGDDPGHRLGLLGGLLAAYVIGAASAGVLHRRAGRSGSGLRSFSCSRSCSGTGSRRCAAGVPDRAPPLAGIRTSLSLLPAPAPVGSAAGGGTRC